MSEVTTPGFIWFDDGTVRAVSEVYYFDGPPLKSGEELEVTLPFVTLGGESYQCSDKLLILRRTLDAPHGHLASLGNLLARGKDGRSTVWSTIEFLLAKKAVKRVTA